MRRKKKERSVAISVDLLDPAVRGIKAEIEKDLGHKYGVDSFTTYEVESVRNRLAERDPKLAGVPVDDLRQQIINRRKQGAYPSTVFPNGNGKRGKLGESPEWYGKYLQSAWWLAFRRIVIQFWGYRCALCGEDGGDDDLNVHHNRYCDERGSLLCRETMTDVICLCGKCHSRFHERLPRTPDVEPEPLD